MKSITHNKIDTVLFYFKVIYMYKLFLIYKNPNKRFNKYKQKNHFSSVKFLIPCFFSFIFKNQRILYYFLLFLLLDGGLCAIVGVGPNKLI